MYWMAAIYPTSRKGGLIGGPFVFVSSRCLFCLSFLSFFPFFSCLFALAFGLYYIILFLPEPPLAWFIYIYIFPFFSFSLLFILFSVFLLNSLFHQVSPVRVCSRVIYCLWCFCCSLAVTAEDALMYIACASSLGGKHYISSTYSLDVLGAAIRSSGILLILILLIGVRKIYRFNGTTHRHTHTADTFILLRRTTDARGKKKMIYYDAYSILMKKT